MRPLSQFPRIAVAVAGLLAASSALCIVWVDSPWRLHLVSNLMQAAVVLWAALCSAEVAQRSSGYMRQLWNLWVAALGTLAAATLLVAYWASFRATPAATPWPSDVLNFLWVAPVVMMFVPWSAEESGTAKWQYVLDFVQVGVVALTAFLYFFYVPAVWEVHGEHMFRLLRETTAARNVVITAALALRAATQRKSSARTFFAWLTWLFVVVTVCDLISMSNFGQFSKAAEWLGSTWSIPYLLAAVFAATWDTSKDTTVEAPSAGEGWVVSHFFAVAIPLLVILMGARIVREQMAMAWVTIGVSFTCSAARLILTNAQQQQIAKDLRRTEQALRSSEQMFASAFRASPDAMSIGLLPEGNILEMNESYARLTGFSREEALGKTPRELGLWADLERVTELRRLLRENGQVREKEFRFRRKDGELRSGRISATTITLEGRPCLLVIVADITERKEAEEAVRATEARFRSLVNELQVGLVVVNPKGEIQYSNPANNEMLGWNSGQEYLGKTASDLGLAALREDGTEMPLSDRPVAQAILTRRPVRGVVMGWRRPNRPAPLWIIGNAIPIVRADGEIDSVIGSFADITDLRKTQEALRTSEQRYRSLVEALRVGITTWGADGRAQFVNEALLEMFQVTREQVLGRKSGDIARAIGEDGVEVPGHMRPVARALATGKPVRGVVLGWILPHVKDLVWTLADATPEFGPDGQLARVIASLTDITDRKRAEEQKRISEEMFSKAFHSSPDSMTISTLADGRYIEVNEGYTRMFGWSREEAVGRTTIEMGVWPDSGSRDKLREMMSRHGRVSEVELQLRTKAGQLRTILVSADVIELNGQPCMLAVSDDITEWKAAQEALRFSEERFRTLVENLAVAVVLHGPDGKIRFVNRAAQEAFGLRNDLVLGKRPSEIGLEFVAEDGSEMPEHMHPIHRVIATGQPMQSLVMGWRMRGSSGVLWIFGSVVPQFGPDGKIAAVIASCADITPQKRAEESLRQLSAHLLHLQDEERRRLGRDLHDSLAQSVLAVNLSLAQVTKTGQNLDDRSRVLLAQARGLLQDMSRQIRTLSYLLHPPLLDELGLASAVKEYAQGFSERSGIHLEVNVSSGFRRLPQETETALFRIVQESLSNIQRHSGSKTARIHLDGMPGRILLQVSDQGRGMAGGRDKELNAPGTRLGVGILGMRERMAQLGGTLEIESGASGTTVRATLPLRVEELHAASHSGG